jgi:hypothetical protein
MADADLVGLLGQHDGAGPAGLHDTTVTQEVGRRLKTTTTND